VSTSTPDPDRRLRVAVVGCGVISAEYLEGCRQFDQVAVVACADMLEERARSRAEDFGVAMVLTPEEAIAADDVDAILNLTPPQAHREVSMAALRAGKHVYSEKPLALSTAEGRELLEAADEMGVRLGCAPDTFLGGGLQTSRKVIDDGWIGDPVAATAFFASHGYEHFHPSVDHLYGPGGGPLLDMGPYYVTAMVNLFGPVRKVTGMTRGAGATREVPAQPGTTRTIAVDVPTHAAATLEFASGVIASLITSWDVWSSRLPYMEVYGTEGSLSVPNPDLFDGEPAVLRPGPRELEDDPPRSSESWRPLPLTHRGDVGRGIGIADLADALATDRPHRASGSLALHVLEVLLAVESAADAGAHVAISHPCSRPEAMPGSVIGYPVRF
jgi:predicted dehydrogenase